LRRQDVLPECQGRLIVLAKPVVLVAGHNLIVMQTAGRQAIAANMNLSMFKREPGDGLFGGPIQLERRPSRRYKLASGGENAT
jgi:hypothetical protein